MVLTPLYRIVGDIELFAIGSIQVTDSIANESDSITIECESFIAKEPNSKIELFLGYANTAFWSVGAYTLQSVNYTPHKATLLFTSAEFDKSFKEKQTTSFQKLTIKDLISKIAAKHNLESKCDMTQFLEHIDQKNESDMALLNRLANKYNAIFNIKNKKLIFLSKNSKELPIFDIDKSQTQSWNIFTNNKFLYNSVNVKYHDIKTNKKTTIKVGDKEPVYHIEETQKNKTEAQNIAEAKQAQLLAQSQGGNITLEGQNIIAGAKINITNYNPTINGTYLITNAEHTISTTFTSSITIEKIKS